MGNNQTSKTGNGLNTNHQVRPNVNLVLEGLKDFQRNTVDYVFHQLYMAEKQASRFLIADEVGLGKTLVARGVIAKVVDHLWDEVNRIDVVYICSNQDIAQQNIDRLNITNERTFQHASRATLLPVKVQQLKGNKLNFISLTPGTSFNLSSQTGRFDERIVLLNLLKKAWRVSEASLSNIMRGDVRPDIWKIRVDEFEKYEKIDSELEKAFIDALNQKPELREDFERLSKLIDPRRKKMTQEMLVARNSLIGKLRRLLAKSSLTALEPDLIILDEFQRFKYLLEEDNDIALLAQELFDYQDATGRQAKVLLLSATPYKMYTLSGEEGENHYEDFLRTAKFLLNSYASDLDILVKSIEQFRYSFLGLNTSQNSHEEMRKAKNQIEGILRKVMVRTERLAVSKDRNGMLQESLLDNNKLRSGDLRAFVYLDKIASLLGVEDQVEYWKSSSYPLNLMEDYKLKKKFQEGCKKGKENGLYTLVKNARPSLLEWDDIQQYKEVDPGNHRLRILIEKTLDSGNWQLLWIPPSLPYYLPEGPFARVGRDGQTKSLIFSAWRVVPKVISVMLSYEAERRIIGEGKRDFSYSDLLEKRRGLLRFSISRGRKTGMSVFALIYPCLTLAKEIDPLVIAKQAEHPYLSSSFFMLQKIKRKLRLLFKQACSDIQINESGPIDESWYWLAPLLLDRHFNSKLVEDWLKTEKPDLSWVKMLRPGSNDGDEDDESAFAEHIKEFTSYLGSNIQLGRQPSDLLDVIARIALASPAVTALRAMMRVANHREGTIEFMAGAAQAGLGFRTLCNQPDTILLLQVLYKDLPEEERVFWKMVLSYNIAGNLQAVWDEYIHVLNESLGLKGHAPEDFAKKWDLFYVKHCQ